MNCVNHPDLPVAAFCQNCGKALCSQCTRPVAGMMYCEQCLAARVGVPGAQPGAPFPPGVAVPVAGPNPAAATLLGFIPGVGAMYNGQFVKAMIHVLVFVILIAITDEHGFFGIFIAAWIFYQVFDANQTAKARRDGLPLPDPFGLNELAIRLGSQNPGTVHPGAPPMPVNPAAGYPPYPPPPTPPAASFVGEAYPPPPPPPAGGATYVPPPPGVPYPPPAPFPDVPPPFPEPARRSEPAGAIALIALGLVFLFGTLGIFRFDWIGRGWPLIIIAVGIWLFLKRAREHTPGGGQ